MEQDLIEKVLKIDAEDGDVLFITLPDITMPRTAYELYAKNIREKFEELFSDKDVRIAVMPYGSKVEIIKSKSFG